MDQPRGLGTTTDRVRLARVCLSISKNRGVVAAKGVPQHVVEVALEDVLCSALLAKDTVKSEQLSLVYPDRVCIKN